MRDFFKSDTIRILCCGALLVVPLTRQPVSSPMSVDDNVAPLLQDACNPSHTNSNGTSAVCTAEQEHVFKTNTGEVKLAINCSKKIGTYKKE